MLVGIFHSGHTGQVRASGTSAAFGTCMHCMAPASARASHRSSAASGSEGLEVESLSTFIFLEYNL